MAYKTDIAFTDDFIVKPSGDFETLTNLEQVKERLYRRLITTKGAIIHRPNFGVGVKDFIGSLNHIGNQRSLAQRIDEQFRLDPDVERVLGTSITNTDKEPELVKLLVRVQVVGYGEQAFSFIPFGETV